MESKAYPVPERVRAGSPNPITDLDSYREAWMRAQANPDGSMCDQKRYFCLGQ